MGRGSEALAAAGKAANLVDVSEGNIQLARFWALKGNREQALHYLSRAAELRLTDSNVPVDALLEEGTEFSLFDADPAFEAILNELNRQGAGG
jgi:hypothetical protein